MQVGFYLSDLSAFNIESSTDKLFQSENRMSLELSLFKDDSDLACSIQLTLLRGLLFLIGLGAVSSLNEATLTFHNQNEIVNVFRLPLKASSKYRRSMGL